MLIERTRVQLLAPVNVGLAAREQIHFNIPPQKKNDNIVRSSSFVSADDKYLPIAFGGCEHFLLNPVVK
jgi:hypothetical protein